MIRRFILTSEWRWIFVIWRRDQKSTKTQRPLDVMCLLGSVFFTEKFQSSIGSAKAETVLLINNGSDKLCHSYLCYFLMICIHDNKYLSIVYCYLYNTSSIISNTVNMAEILIDHLNISPRDPPWDWCWSGQGQFSCLCF